MQEKETGKAESGSILFYGYKNVCRLEKMW